MRVTFRIPLWRALLAGFLFACALVAAIACTVTWFYLLGTICRNPRTPMPGHLAPYSCHGMKVFIAPWQDTLLHWLVPAGSLFVVAALLAASLLVLAAARGGASQRVRIVAVPPGEAPQWVREQWVGLELPLAQSSAVARSWRAAGVLTGSSGAGSRREGYVVNVREAVAILEGASPEAAQWWRVNAAHMMTPARCFVFPAQACAVLH